MADIIFNGPEGRLEGRYHQAETPGAPVAVVLHPHPLYGGSMNNKIVYTIFHAFKDAGFSVLRFNFRGVGRSQGKYDDGIGELSDAATAMDWLQQQNPEASTCWIGGFSFGSWISMQLLMRRPEIEGFITVAPPSNLYDFSFLAPCPSSGLVIQGNRDEIVPEENVSKLLNKVNTQKGKQISYAVVDGADHYFRNQLDPLRSHIDDYLAARSEEFMGRRQPPDKKRRQLPRD
jgi:uncharacterized protein